MLDAKTLRLSCRGKQTKTEALKAAAATLRLMLQSADGVEPLGMVVVGVYPTYAETFGMTFALVLSRLVFFLWKDVGIIIIYGGTYSVLQQPFDNGRRARGATCVEQHLAAVVGNGYGRPVGLLCVMTIFHFDDYFGAKIQ